MLTCQHAVLVGTGKEVQEEEEETPFSSILQSVVERIRSKKSLGNLLGLDLVWVNRDFR